MSKNVDKVNQYAIRSGEAISEEIHAIRHLFRSRRYRGRQVAGHELSPMEARVLYFIGGHAGSTQSDVVTHFARDKAQVARIIAVLRKAEMLEASADANDRRVQRLHLTTLGDTVCSEVSRERARLASRAIEGIDAAELVRLMTLLARIRSNLESD